MKKLIKKVLSLFRKPEEEVVFPKAEIAAWPFPIPSEDFEPRPKKKRPQVKKATTRKPKAPVKTVAKKATKVAKKAK